MRVTVLATLVVPTTWLVKLKLVGLTVAATTPVPFKLTTGLRLASSAMVSVPVRVPETTGVKNTEMEQLAAGRSVPGLMGQLLVNI